MGALLRSIKREEVKRGQVLCAPGSIKAHKKFGSTLYVRTKDEGGRHTPFTNHYRPQLFLRTSDVTADITLTGDKTIVMPGDNVEVNIELNVPVPVESGLRFTVREGGKTVGTGVVTKIIE